MDVTFTNMVLLFVAGIGSGLIGYLAGLASLVSYPALLAVGLSPLAANATNTIAVVGGGWGAAFSGREMLLEGDRRRLITECALAAIGGIAGAVLLLVTGEKVFATVVPWLIAISALTLLLSPTIKRFSGTKERWFIYRALLLIVCVYGGYFGAGSGIVALATLRVLTNYLWERAVLLKTILLALANVTASIVFIFLAPISWAAAIIMFAGNIVGGYIGPTAQRHIPEPVSRYVIAAGGFYLAWTLL